jgi:4-diphosphocytidyl-2-C-methyl-D-erythritol kinase
MTLYDVPAPAKLNLFLHVVGRRHDGYHLLQTVFRFIEMADTLHFAIRGDGLVSRANDVPGVSASDDLTVRAARALQSATRTRQGVEIFLQKRIPQGGGLGGGSSDAASTLLALNRLWGTGLSRRELMALALPLGADVPVFIFGQSAFAEGVGERLTAVPLPERAYLIAQPDASVATAGIFSDYGLTRDTPLVEISDFLTRLKGGVGCNSLDGDSTYDNRVSPSLSGLSQAPFFGRNDLEPVVFRRYPEVKRAAQWLGNNGMCVRMTGSGACLYAEYAEISQAVLAQRKITATMPLVGEVLSQAHVRFRLVQACAGLAEHPLRNWVIK